MTKAYRHLSIFIKKKPCIDTPNHKVPTIISKMKILTLGLFENLEITSKIYLDLRIKYTGQKIKKWNLKKFV